MSSTRPTGTPHAADLPSVVEQLAAGGPNALAVLVDFDGTLAPIVDDPQAARPDPQAQAALRELAALGVPVACITGRPALQARALLGIPEILYSGLHGAELLGPDDEEPTLPAAYAAAGETIAQLVGAAQAEPEALAGLDVEHKGPIVALHWRRSADPAAAEARAQELGARAREAGLATGTGRAVLELRPSLKITKGDGARALLQQMPGARAALIAGDDVTDLDAFAEISDAVSDGRLQAATLLAVHGHDAPAAVAAAAGVTLTSPAELGALLALLVTALGVARA